MPAELSDTLRQIADAYAACTRCADLGVPPDPRREALWELAEATRPVRVRVLFLAESPPQRNRRGRWSYFHLPAERPPGEDPSELFWALAEMLALPEACGVTYAAARAGRETWKPRLLAEFRRRGLWLLDGAKCALNGVTGDRRRGEALGRCAETWLWRELRAIEPEHVVLIKATVRDRLEPLLVRWGLGPRIVGRERIPHPGSGQRANFRRAMRQLIGGQPGLFLPPELLPGAEAAREGIAPRGSGTKPSGS
jgi:hypothetical protein